MERLEHLEHAVPANESSGAMDCESPGVIMNESPRSARRSRHARILVIAGIVFFVAVLVAVTAIAVPLSNKNSTSGAAGASNSNTTEESGNYSSTTAYDVVVYGDSSAAVVAAVAAKRQGRSVVLVNPTHFLGGMSASGLGAIDFGNCKNEICIGGIAAEFYSTIASAYGMSTVRNFEPHVGQKVFNQLIEDANVTVFFNEELDRETGVEMDGPRIVSITMLSGKTYEAKMFIDATYVGDLMAAAGVSYTVGRESEDTYGESLAGQRRGDIEPRNEYFSQGDKDHFIVDVDPYLVEGDPDSGLLPHVTTVVPINGQADERIQAYNYRLCLTRDPTHLVNITKPEGYREIDHELVLRNFEANDTRLPALVEQLAGTGSKVDWNSMHAVGTDYVGANYEYPEANYSRRAEIEQAHRTYIQGHLWTLANSDRVDPSVRERVAKYGLTRDEFIDNGHWPYMMYIREARRMISDYVMTQHNAQVMLDPLPDPVGLANFGMDSHAVQYFVDEEGHVLREGVIFLWPPGPYQVSYRSIVPRNGECENLFSPVCLSCSHVAHGSIRMEPVFMILAESAAIAASVAIESHVVVQDVDYAILRSRLETSGQELGANGFSFAI